MAHSIRSGVYDRRQERNGLHETSTCEPNSDYSETNWPNVIVPATPRLRPAVPRSALLAELSNDPMCTAFAIESAQDTPEISDCTTAIENPIGLDVSPHIQGFLHAGSAIQPSMVTSGVLPTHYVAIPSVNVEPGRNIAKAQSNIRKVRSRRHIHVSSKSQVENAISEAATLVAGIPKPKRKILISIVPHAIVVAAGFQASDISHPSALVVERPAAANELSIDMSQVYVINPDMNNKFSIEPKVPRAKVAHHSHDNPLTNWLCCGNFSPTSCNDDGFGNIIVINHSASATSIPSNDSTK